MPALKLVSASDDLFDSLCDVQGVFVISLYLAINCWTAAFAFHCHGVLVHGKGLDISNRIVNFAWVACGVNTNEKQIHTYDRTIRIYTSFGFSVVGSCAYFISKFRSLWLHWCLLIGCINLTL